MAAQVKQRLDMAIHRVDDGVLLEAARIRAYKQRRGVAATIASILTGEDKPFTPQELKAAKAVSK